jgi:hypothetical protein
MKDCHKDIQDYLTGRVKLSQTSNANLTSRRDANRARVKDGLRRDGRPAPTGFVTQGSRAMGTMIQEPGNTYDIDDGIIFEKSDLVGKQGAEISALEARRMVRDAVDDGSFKTKPEIRANCVRVTYDDGPNVDIPVYRRLADGSFELASANWRKSDPEGVNLWFKNSADGKTGNDAPQQFRSLIQLQKKLCVNRPSFSRPSGFVLSVLTNEAFHVADDRLDRVFRACITTIHSRLCGSLLVRHPVVAENLAEYDDPKVRGYRDMIGRAIQDLKVLDKNNCLRSEALKAWKKVFNANYFDAAIEEAEEDQKKKAEDAVVKLIHVPKPWCR